MLSSATVRHLCERFIWRSHCAPTIAVATCSALNGCFANKARESGTRARELDHWKQVQQRIRDRTDVLRAPQVTDTRKMQEFRESLHVLREAMPTLDSIPIIHQPKFKALSVENPPEFLLRLLTIISQHASVNHEVQIRTSAVSDGEKVTIPFLQRSLEAVARADEFLAAQLGEEVVTRGGGSVQQGSEEAPEASLEELKYWLEYAEAAYDQMASDELITKWLQERGYSLEIASRDNKANCPVFFVASHEERSEVVIAVRGTMTLSDVVTDMIVTPDEWGSEALTVHSGIGNAARNVYERIEALVKQRVAAGNSVVVVGHSLGAGSAALLSWLLREQADVQNLRAFAFATPPCASPALAAQTKAYVTSCVMRDDAVPRMAPRSMIALQELALALSWEELAECSESWGFMGRALLRQAQNGTTDIAAIAGDIDDDSEADAPLPETDDTAPARRPPGGDEQGAEESSEGVETDKKASNWSTYSAYYSTRMQHGYERAAEFFRQFKPAKEERGKAVNPLMLLVDALHSAGIIPGATTTSQGTIGNNEVPADAVAAAALASSAEASTPPAEGDAAEAAEEPTQVMLSPVVPGTIVFLRPKPVWAAPDAPDQGSAAPSTTADEEGAVKSEDEPTLEFDRMLIDAKDTALAVLRVHSASVNDHFLNQYRLGLGMELVGGSSA